ncbi:MAG: DUF4232 domain-containing protein [Kocuria sp.]|nr:DUF4232 domain-containing protein [Kocuria sp.]
MSPHQHHTAFCLTSLACALILTGCGNSSDVESPTPSPQQTHSAVSTAPHTPTESSAPDVPDAPALVVDPGDVPAQQAQPTTTPPPGAAKGGAAASVEECTAQNLSGSITTTNTQNLNLVLTNNADQACTLSSIPQVFFAGSDGGVIGLPARATADFKPGVMVLPGASATLSLRHNLSSLQAHTCNPHTTHSVVVQPVGSTTVVSIPHQSQACGNPKLVQLEITGFSA